MIQACASITLLVVNILIELFLHYHCVAYDSSNTKVDQRTDTCENASVTTGKSFELYRHTFALKSYSFSFHACRQSKNDKIIIFLFQMLQKRIR